MLESFLDHSIEALTVAAMGLFTFLVRSFFSRIHDDLKALKSSIDKFDGRLTHMQEEARDLQVNLAVAKQELRAVWRHIDNAHQRASDYNGEDE